ncbi:MAG: hypothetical protein WD063_00125 [Pirellulales bacterium]
MVKTLLSAVLVATQLVSWNASPLYLCLGADGSICVDFGPAGCGCCRNRPAEKGCCGSQHEADVCGQLPLAVDNFDPCGCDHIQISEPQSAMLVRTTAAPDAQGWGIPLVAALCTGASGCCISATSADAPRCPCDAHSTALVLLASVVMRC